MVLQLRPTAGQNRSVLLPDAIPEAPRHPIADIETEFLSMLSRNQIRHPEVSVIASPRMASEWQLPSVQFVTIPGHAFKSELEGDIHGRHFEWRVVMRCAVGPEMVFVLVIARHFMTDAVMFCMPIAEKVHETRTSFIGCSMKNLVNGSTERIPPKFFGVQNGEETLHASQ